ncbi:MAG: alanine racemase [Hyphomicrobiales bacterium]|nr:alanine racemase [Hyphomicrobiales bacterium]
MAVSATEEAGARLTIDLKALAANYRLLAGRVGAAECAAVVKADAYGLGVEKVVPALADAGALTFFVALPNEARQVRSLAGEATVYILNGLTPGAAATYAEIGARPVLCTADEVAEWASFCRAAGKRLPAALHVDTGMNRLGLSLAEARALARETAGALDDFELALVMSHFVSSELPDDPLNASQIADFAALGALFAGVPASLANSSGIFLSQQPHFDLVRPGYALYGGNPQPGLPNPMAPVVRLEARIMQLRNVKAGATVGYNAQWTAPGPRRLATLALGYADGFPRPAGAACDRPGGGAIIAGKPCPVVGRVSMDLIVADVTGLGEGAVRRGDWACVLGPEIGVDALGEAGGTIGYEILTRLGRRFARIYVDGTTGAA